MNSFVKETVVPLIVMFLGVLAVASILTVAFLANDAHHCHQQGGHYSIEGTTAWCRF